VAGMWAVPAALVFSRSYEKEDPGRLRGPGSVRRMGEGLGLGGTPPDVSTRTRNFALRSAPAKKIFAQFAPRSGAVGGSPPLSGASVLSASP
jgi:hypothetical protein